MSPKRVRTKGFVRSRGPRWGLGWVLVGALGIAGCYDGREGGGQDGDEAGTDGNDDAGPEEQCEGDPGETLVRRLTVVEYTNTVFDTFGVDITTEAQAIPPELRSDGFSNTAAAMLTTFQHVDAYHDLSEVIVDGVADWPGFVSGLTGCKDFNATCEEEFIRGLGLRVWRRPLSDAEVMSFTNVFAAVSGEGDDFDTGAKLVARAMLESPQFLYRLEDEMPREGAGVLTQPLTDYEIANRLSYLVWGSAPDDALYASAAAGTLGDPAEIETQVRRMLESPRARETSARYAADWMALDTLVGLNRDPAQYPGYTSQLGLAMRDETLAVVEEVLWEQGGSLEQLLTTDFTMVSRELAEFYGFPNPQDGVNRYPLADIEHRAGILTHAGILAVNGHGNRPSIVERGLFMLRGVMCSAVAAPPANVDTSMSDLEPDQSGRFYSEARLANATCVPCHGQFDPLGWGFESFDGVGAWQETDEFGNALKQDGWLPAPGGEPAAYATVEEYIGLLAADEGVLECVGIRKPLQFAIGRPLDGGDVCGITNLEETLAQTTGTYADLVVSIATHPSFRRIRIADES